MYGFPFVHSKACDIVCMDRFEYRNPSALFLIWSTFLVHVHVRMHPVCSCPARCTHTHAHAVSTRFSCNIKHCTPFTTWTPVMVNRLVARFPCFKIPIPPIGLLSRKWAGSHEYLGVLVNGDGFEVFIVVITDAWVNMLGSP